MAEHAQGLLDTPVVIDNDVVDSDALPEMTAISAITLAELAGGAQVAADAVERANRQDRLQWAANTWDPLAFDADAARAYGRVFAAAQSAGRQARRRMADLLIAATAVSNGLPLYTRNKRDFEHLEDLLTVVEV